MSGALLAGTPGACVGLVGASAPLKELQKRFGFTVDAVVEAAKDQVATNA